MLQMMIQCHGPLSWIIRTSFCIFSWWTTTTTTLNIVCADLAYAGDLTTGPVMIIPGLASTQLEAWNTQACSSFHSINVGDRIWMSVTRVLVQKQCWMNCMKLCVVGL